MFRMAVPCITAQLINALYNIVDRIYIGRLPDGGTAALAGLGVSFPIIMVISAFASLIGQGGAPLSSIRLGESRKDEAERILGCSFSSLILVSIGLTLFFLVVKNPLLRVFGASETIFPYADQYLSIYLVGTIFVQLSLGMNYFITAQGFASVSMKTVIIGAVLKSLTSYAAAYMLFIRAVTNFSCLSPSLRGSILSLKSHSGLSMAFSSTFISLLWR